MALGNSTEDYLFKTSPNTWRNNFAPQISGLMADSADDWITRLGLRFDIRNIEAELWLQRYKLKFAQDDILNTTRRGIKDILAQGMEDGWGIDTLSNNLNMTFDKWLYDKGKAEDFAWLKERTPLYRTELIARTETTRAANAGSYNLFKQWGVGEKEWLATGDDRTRDSHLAMNEQVVAIDEKFTSGMGNSLDYPGDPSAPLADTANCRCTVLPFGKKPTVKEQEQLQKDNTYTSFFNDFVKAGDDTKPVEGSSVMPFIDDWKKQLSKLTDEQRQAMKDYTGSWYMSINDTLRGVSWENSPEVRLRSNNMMSAINNFNGLDRNLTLRRGMRLEAMQKLGIDLDNPNNMIGKIFQDKGFMSTTIDNPRYAVQKPVNFLFNAPQGTKGAYLGNISTYPEEFEWIMQAGTKFKITNIEEVKGNYLIYAEILP